ncbi:Poly-beta-1,6-N-acetyl-D-glucosamine synthase [Vibrio aerogenes CECT 7868]|uniref:Poly-beta-1,6-N-acetyl-D-glucosamine synthase n=1 Tax=Vibrio aerogenes CECT 7868 TaxID=1216006 RepID=A0A1M5ZB19_9VIBR|nr:glycosyltransferase family 2 protein [Vibrio aerogenes]SHI21399.1 Poly-beta-1,6-N-acetyl-D-glucosamine synthase [Vibrio aerogenes CECT 7868]
MTILMVTFWVAAGLIIYHHFGYPLWLRWYAGRHPGEKISLARRGYQSSGADEELPTVTVLIPAYNEARWIAEKIRNLSALDYPKKRLKIIIACDGCEDETSRIAQETIQEAICAETYFEIHDYPENRGKIAIINHEMQSFDSDLTVLSDTSALISVDALLIAARHFENERLGVLNSRYQLLETPGEGEAKYWHYQSQIKQHEASTGATMGSHGAFYIFRTHLFEPLAQNTINDDFILPMKIVKQGYQSLYDSEMRALELEPTSLKQDFQRRLRISAGNMQQLIVLSGLLNPKYGLIAFSLFSGKGLRLFIPYLMLTCLICNVLLIHHPFYLGLLLIQMTVYSTPAVAQVFPGIRQYKPLQWMHYFLTGHWANLLGGLRYLSGMETNRWTKINHKR